MKKEDFFEIFGELDDDIIDDNITKKAEASTKKKRNWRIWGAMAACLCLVAVYVFVIQNSGTIAGMGVGSPQPGGKTEPDIIQSNNNPETSVPPQEMSMSALEVSEPASEVSMPAKDNYLVVNETDTISMADMDVKYSFYNKMPYHVWQAILEDFRKFTGISYEDFIARVPDTWEFVNFYSLEVHGYKGTNLSEEYRLHDYVFDYRTADGSEARIALCPSEEPLRDYFLYCDNPEKSEINGVSIIIYGFNDLFIAAFSYEKVNYDIETKGISLEELEKLLSGILTVSESVPSNQ